MTKYGMRVSRDFKAEIFEIAEVKPSDLTGLPVIERPSDPDNDVMDELEEKAERLQRVHDESHRRFDMECERMGI